MNIVVIADDLTGANDTGVQFLKKGFPVEVFLTAIMKTSPKKNQVSILNTESRSLSPKQAYKKLLKISEEIHIDTFDYVYKKIDSTMRGNIGIEIDALLNGGHFDAAIVAPAYPENGRKVIGGYHLIHGELLEDTEISRDPKTPVKESYLPSLIESQSDYQVGHIEESVIRSNTLDRHLQSALNNGQKIIVVDSSTNDDLDHLANELTKLPQTFLWVGSAALAQSLSKAISLSKERINDKNVALRVNQQDNTLPVLTIAGSVSGTTTAQVNYLKKQGFSIFRLKPNRLLSDHFFEEISDVIDEMIHKLTLGEDVAVTTQHTEDVMEELQSLLKSQHITLQKAGALIAERLGYIGAAIVQAIKVKGLVLTGGDIAFATCSTLGLDGLTILDEVEEGIPLCEVTEGPFNHLKVVTKAGAFGKEASLHHAVQIIKTS